MSQNRYASPRSFNSRHGRRNNNRPSGGYTRSRRGPQKQVINHSKFIKPARLTEQIEHQPKHAFSDFDVHPILAQNIADKGFIKPSPIQDKAIPAALLGNDVVGLANTGTGKTAAFLIPLINKLISDPHQHRAIIIAPTRELAYQIYTECRTFINGSRVYATVLTGGSPMWPQIRDLRRNPQIVIGTPGRIKDHFKRENLDLSLFDTLVLDEVDRMLDMGFINDITTLLSQLKENRQSLFFSATMDNKVEKLIKTFSSDPEYISVKTGNTRDNIDQNIVKFRSTESKIEMLHEILNQENVMKTIVFEETRRDVDKLTRELSGRGFEVDSIHGDKSQGQRKRALGRFRDSTALVLVATDVAARGIDIPDITHVINYSTPSTYDDYVHRIGRVGRADSIGYALTFVRG